LNVIKITETTYILLVYDTNIIKMAGKEFWL